MLCPRERCENTVQSFTMSRAWNACMLGISARCIPIPRHAGFGFLISVKQSGSGRKLSQFAVSSLREDGESRSSVGREDGTVVANSNLVNAKELVENLVTEDGKVKRFLKGAEIDRESFSRVYTLTALRVPAEDCGVYVSRVKEHLLNWPRVKNVARVEGDDGDSALESLFWEKTPEKPQSVVESVRVAVYGDNSAEDSQVRQIRRLTRVDKLTQGVDSVFGEKQMFGDRPLVRGASRKSWEEGAVTVEVVETFEDKNGQNSDNDFDDLDKWKRATRLLLLDESYSGKTEHKIPQIVQMILQNKGCELVQCRLTLAYDYWPMDEILRQVLPAGMTIPSAYESVGHIAHLNLRNEHLPFRHVIAQIVLEKNKPRIRTVVNKTDVIHNKYRTMQLELLAGNSSLITTVVEHGLSLRVDLAAVYWNSRLATERQRLVDTFNEKDIVCDMFAGVGPIAIVAGKKVKYVYANDLNPIAVTYMQHNVSLNKLGNRVEVSNEDGRQFVQNLLARDPPVFFSQVVMNLPLDAAEFLDVFKHAFARDIWGNRALPRIHVYGFSKASNPEAEYSDRIADVLGEMPHPIDIHRVRLVAPGKWMLCASFRLPAVAALTNESSIQEFA